MFISSLSIVSCPLFHAFNPPHSWMFHPTRGFSSTRRVTGSTSMCRDPWMGSLSMEYAPPSINGGTPRVACNRFDRRVCAEVHHIPGTCPPIHGWEDSTSRATCSMQEAYKKVIKRGNLKNSPGIFHCQGGFHFGHHWRGLAQV